ncbi:hypothetical protein EV702DRAFT_1051518 [Suillus placidus]|uniref:Uncharacterized protein n=1 Tax=Suillus placidus TaxID=48579 RepID=A0A9P6ZGE9_9AGAM|nr:hypothetical protein EV702DRAFT_1051518 [Suillus placidus]
MLPLNPQLPNPPTHNSNQMSSRAQSSFVLSSSSNNSNTMLSGSLNPTHNFFYVKAADCVLFSAMQTVCLSFSEVKDDFKHEDPDPEEIFKLRFTLRQYIQTASTPDDMELKYSGPLLQCLATININYWICFMEEVGRLNGAYDPKTFKADKSKLAAPCKAKKITVGSVINKTISEDTAPDSSMSIPNSLHRWDALIEAHKHKQVDFDNHASDSIKKCVHEHLEKAANFLLPTRPDGTRFFMWYRSKKGRFRGEIDFEDA